MRLDMKMKKIDLRKRLNGTALHLLRFVRRLQYPDTNSVVRRIVGYYRFEGEDTRSVMADLYQQHNMFVNFFFPSMKIISKHRIYNS